MKTVRGIIIRKEEEELFSNDTIAHIKFENS